MSRLCVAVMVLSVLACLACALAGIWTEDGRWGETAMVAGVFAAFAGIAAMGYDL